MKHLFIILAFLLQTLFIISCTEKISYSGKIHNYKDDVFNNITSKNEVINYFGEPSFIDPIEKKYFYFSEKKITKNFFKNNVSERKLIVFEFNYNDLIKSINEFNLDDQNNTNLIKEQTSNDLIKQGLLEKIFGGIGGTPTTQ